MASSPSEDFGSEGAYGVVERPVTGPISPEARSRIGTSREMYVLMAVVLLLIAASIILFRSDVFNDVDARLLTLFSVAGALGGTLRSFAYSLALASFTPRERRQWRTEALVAPVVGALAGLVAYLFVRASLVGPGNTINREGQYLLSLVAGMVALRPLGTIVERGVVRSSLNRSGILGGEVSPTVPILDRIERVLEERLSEVTLINYAGWVLVTPRALTPRRWSLDVSFDTSQPEHGVTSGFSLARVNVAGGEDRDLALFNVSVSPGRLLAAPLIVSVAAPLRGLSEPVTIFLEEPHETGGAGPDAPPWPAQPVEDVTLEIGQGDRTVQALRVRLPV